MVVIVLYRLPFVDVLECSSDPCLNGATCLEETNNYVCICQFGYEGDRCETYINFCDSTPCENGATCEDFIGGYQCVCVQGYEGENCERG